MSQNDKIKELIDNYKRPLKNTLPDNRILLYERFMDKLESLLDECDHKNKTIKRSGMLGMSLCKVCDNCKKVLAIS